MNDNSNFTQIPQNSKVFKIGLTFLFLVFAAVFIAAFNFMLQDATSLEARVYAWPLVTIVLFIVAVYMFKHTVFKSKSNTKAANAFRKIYSVLRNILIAISIIGYTLNNNLMGYAGAGLFYKTLCHVFSLFNPQIVISLGLLLVIILHIAFVERISRNIFWLFIWILLFTASALLLPASITSCLV
jgi:hypothetical protein